MHSEPQRILIAGALESPHFQRWCEQLSGMPFEFHLLPTNGLDSSLRDRYPGFTVHIYKPSFIARMIARLLRFCGVRIRNRFLENRRVAFIGRILEKVRPQVVHSHGLNVNWRNQMVEIHMVRRSSRWAHTTPWLYTSWGTDLDFFPKVDAAQDKIIRQIMPDVDILVTECERDRRLACEYGFSGFFWGKLPMFGGVDERLLAELCTKTSARRLILVKGRDNNAESGQDPVGRAWFILDAVERERDILEGYDIVVLQASPHIAERVDAIAKNGISISAPQRFASYNDVLSLFWRARAFIAMTVNDGLPSSLCEAMAAGALPVHSDLESVAEWIKDGENGILTPPEDVDAIAAALRRVVSDDALLDSAAVLNRKAVNENLRFGDVRKRVLQLYHNCVAFGREGAQ